MAVRHRIRLLCAALALALFGTSAPAQERPTGRARPVIAVVSANEGTETIDFMVPFGVLSTAGVGEVVPVSVESGPVTLVPALTVETGTNLAQFDAAHPAGADYVIVPALRERDNPHVIAWLKAQAAKGAVMVSICNGAATLAATGLLDGRPATAHFTEIDNFAEDFPRVRWTKNRRYLRDGKVMTTAGISAALPASLALVEMIGGPEAAAEVAARIGVASWGPDHDSGAFRLSARHVTTAAWNLVRFWEHETVGIPVAAGIDEIALALAADAHSRTFRTRVDSMTEDGRPVASRHGLTVLGTAADRRRIDRVVAAPAAGQPPARALDEALSAIRGAYDTRTAEFVAMQLEYPGLPAAR